MTARRASRPASPLASIHASPGKSAQRQASRGLQPQARCDLTPNGETPTEPQVGARGRAKSVNPGTRRAADGGSMTPAKQHRHKAQGWSRMSDSIAPVDKPRTTPLQGEDGRR